MAKYQKDSYLLAVSGYLAVILVVFSWALFPGNNLLLFGDDIHRQHYFWQSFFASWVRQGIFPWWNPYLFGGAPFAADPQITPLYPFHWIFLISPQTWAYSVFIAFHLLLAMVGMYWLVSHWTDRLSAWAAGMVFGLSGFFVARIWSGHMGVIAAASYLPLLFGLFWRSIQAKSLGWIVAGGGVLALSLSAGYQSMVLLAVEALGLAALILALRLRQLRPVVRLVQIIGLGLGLAAVQLLPSIEYVVRSLRSYPLPYSWAAYGAHTLANLPELINPFRWGDQYSYIGPPPNYGEHAGFVGVLPLLAAMIALVVWLYRWGGRRQFGAQAAKTEAGKDYLLLWKGILIFTLIAVFGMWVALADNARLDLNYLLWRLVPLYRSLRLPPRHLVLFVFGVSALSGIGISLIKSRLARLVLALVVVLELIGYARHFVELKEVPGQRHDKELIALLSQDKEPYRLLPNFGVWVVPRDSLDFDSVATYGIFSASGYNPTILRNYYEFADAVNNSQTPSILVHDVQVPYLDIASPWLNFLNVKYILVPRSYDPLGGVSTRQFIPVKEDASRDYRLYQNTAVLPRFFFVPSLKLLPNRQAVANLIGQREDPTAAVLVEAKAIKPGATFQPDCQPTDTSKVTITSYSVNRVVLQADTTCNAFLVSSEVFYPGWEAFVDGKKTDIFEGNLAFRTLPIPQGNHTVEYVYVPRIYWLGGVVTLITVVGSLLWILLSKCKREKGIMT